MVALQYKLKALRTKLRDWNWNVFGNLNVSIKSAQDQLLEIKNQISSVGFSDELHSAELEAHCHLNSLLLRQESLLKEQSRVRWLTNGDRNTAFYHSIVTRRKPSSGIHSLEINGVLSTDASLIEQHILHFYSQLFSSNAVNAAQDFSLVHEVIPSLVTEEDNHRLLHLPSSEEIRVVVNDMDGSSAPGPKYSPIVHRPESR